jgi:hypothetical protein
MQDTPIQPSPVLRRGTEPFSTDEGFTPPRPITAETSAVARQKRGVRKGGRNPLLMALVALGIAALVGFFLTIFVFSAHAADKPSAGTITFLDGEASVARGSATSGLAVNSTIYDGDRLKTGAGAKLEAKLSDGSVLRLGGGSELKLDQASFKKGDQGTKTVKMSLTFGRVWASVTKLFGNSEFEVKTENAVAGVRGTRFAVEHEAKGETIAKVISGQVLVSNKPIYAKQGHTKANRVEVQGPQEVSKNQWNELVAGAMQQVRVSSMGELSPVESYAMAGDDWAAWNAERDKALGIVE